MAALRTMHHADNIPAHLAGNGLQFQYGGILGSGRGSGIHADEGKQYGCAKVPGASAGLAGRGKLLKSGDQVELGRVPCISGHSLLPGESVNRQ
jgi:hypothetical protein